MYCSGDCKHLNSKNHLCKLTGERLSHMRYGSRGFRYYVHEHNGICQHDKEEMEEIKNGKQA